MIIRFYLILLTLGVVITFRLNFGIKVVTNSVANIAFSFEESVTVDFALNTTPIHLSITVEIIPVTRQF